MVTRFCSSPKKRRVSRFGRRERNQTSLRTRSRAASDDVTTQPYHRACYVCSRLGKARERLSSRGRTQLRYPQVVDKKSADSARVQRFVGPPFDIRWSLKTK